MRSFRPLDISEKKLEPHEISGFWQINETKALKEKVCKVTERLRMVWKQFARPLAWKAKNAMQCFPRLSNQSVQAKDTDTPRRKRAVIVQ